MPIVQNSIPGGPRPGLLTGNLVEFGRDPLAFFTRLSTFGDIVSLRLGRWPGVFLNHPDLFDEVLLANNTNFIKHTFFWRHVTEIFGRGLVTNEGTPWLRQRRLMQPAFHRDRIAGYAATMVAFTERLLDEWQRDAREVRDLHEDLMRLTMEIATKTLFGADLADETATEVSRAFTDAVEAIAIRFRRPVKIPGWIPLPSNIRYSRAVKRLDRLIYGFIDEKRRTGTGEDLLSMLMETRDENGEPMDVKQIRDEAITIFLAGHETTALTLFWTFHLLAKHPEADARLAREVRDTLGDRAPQLGDLAKMPYLTDVVNESMRLFPPAYAFGREAIADCAIGGYRVPAGTTIFISPWVSHRDARWFHDPDAFKPERWDNDLLRTLPRFAYLPFGGGPRVCIGNSFALMEAALVLASIVRRYRLTHAGEAPQPWASITLRPKGDTRMRLVNR